MLNNANNWMGAKLRVQAVRCATLAMLLGLGLLGSQVGPTMAFGQAVVRGTQRANAQMDGRTYTNPVVPRAHDPWIIKQGDVYHYCFSSRGSIWVASSRSLVDVMSARPMRVWRPEPGKPWSKSLWAPELHWLDGAWYIYVAADDGRNENHRMQVLVRKAPSPRGPFHHAGPLGLADDKWAIDGTALEVGGQLYHLWSGWPGDTNGVQNLYISKMKDPATAEGPRVLLSTPEHDWERRGGDPKINEGPQVLQHAGKTFVVYSASGSWSDFYCLGLLELVGEDPMDPKAWKKHEQPWFESGNGVVAPGHASFTVSPDGKEHWIAYHSARHPGSGWDRVGNLQRFSFDAETGLPVIDPPITPGEATPVPSGDPG